jgi:DnaJ-class molecular chaperone
MPSENFYTTLGVPPGSNAEHIRATYLKLADIMHPDKSTNARHKAGKCVPAKCITCKLAEKFKDVNYAYSQLKDAALRKQYDARLRFSKVLNCKPCKGTGLVEEARRTLTAKPTFVECRLCLGTGQED